MSRGFTLVEMLVAFVILALSLGALLPLLGSAARQAAVAQDYAHALTLADSLLAAVGTAAELRAGLEIGREGELYWSRSVELESDVGDATGARWVPYRVRVEVRWGVQGRERTLALATVRLGVRE